MGKLRIHRPLRDRLTTGKQRRRVAKIERRAARVLEPVVIDGRPWYRRFF